MIDDIFLESEIEKMRFSTNFVRETLGQKLFEMFGREMVESIHKGPEGSVGFRVSLPHGFIFEPRSLHAQHTLSDLELMIGVHKNHQYYFNQAKLSLINKMVELTLSANGYVKT